MLTINVNIALVPLWWWVAITAKWFGRDNMPRLGATPEALEAMSKTFALQGQAAQTMKSALDTQVQQIPDVWSGGNAEKFKASWETYKKTFDNLQRDLEEAQRGIQKQKTALLATMGGGG
jgi:WXG100 family type VII secretion target